MAYPETLSLLRHQPLFQHVAQAQLEALSAATREWRGRRSEVVFHRGDPCDGLYLVVYGKVKLSLYGKDGSEKIIEVINPGQSFAEAVMFLGWSCPVTAELLEDSLLLQVGRAAIDQALAADPDFARAMLAGLSMRLHGLIRDVERYSLQSSAQRVVGYLLQLVPADATSGTVLTLPLSKNLIASRLNLTPETFSRALHQLAAAGLFTVNGRELVLAGPARLASFGL